jgi:hypothetical protein
MRKEVAPPDFVSKILEVKTFDCYHCGSTSFFMGQYHEGNTEEGHNGDIVLK